MLKNLIFKLSVFLIFTILFSIYSINDSSLVHAQGVPSVTKKAVDATGTAVTSVVQGGSVKWVLNITNPSNSPLYLNLNDNGLSNKQTFTFSPYKNASNVITPGANPTVPYSLNGGTVQLPRWENIVGGTASTTTPAAQDGKWQYDISAVPSPATGTVGSIPGHNSNFNINADGDGYTPIFVTMPSGEKRLIEIYHHQFISEPYGNMPDGSGGSIPGDNGFPGNKFPNVNCVSITNNALCALYTSGPLTFSSHQPGVGLGAGFTAQQITAFASAFQHKDIATSLHPKYYNDTVNKKIYFVSGRQINVQSVVKANPGANRAVLLADPQRQAEIGISCWDYANDINCGPTSFMKFGDLDFSIWFNTGVTGELMGDGLTMNGTKAYFHYADFDATNYVVGVAAQIKFGCVDIATGLPCGGPFVYPGVTTEKETYKTTTETVGTKSYVVLDRSKYDSTTGGNQNAVVMCFDTATNAKCAGWTDIIIDTTKDISENGGVCNGSQNANGTDIGDACGTTPSLFVLNGLGLCLGNEAEHVAAGAITVAAYCFDSTGAQIPGISANLLAQTGSITVGASMHGDYNVTLTLPSGLQSPRLYLTQDLIVNGDTPDLNRVYCYEVLVGATAYTPCTNFGTGTVGGYTGYRDFNSCTETRDGVALGCVPGLNIQYGYILDPETQCMYGLAHSGSLWSFDPFTGASPCARSAASKIMNDPTNNMYCSASPTIKADWKWYARVYNAPVGTYSVKFYDPTLPGNSDPATAVALPNGNVTTNQTVGGTPLDIVPLNLGRYANMAAYIVTDEIVSRPFATNLLFSVNYYDAVIGDAPAPEFCMTTTVDNVCNVGTVTNKADLKYGATLYPATGTPTGLTTVSSNVASLTVTDQASCNPSNVGDFVWIDTNRNGIQDAGEVGLNGVTVELYNATTNALVATQTTVTTAGIDGSYLFTSVVAGDYYVKFTLPTGYVFSPANTATGGGTDLNDSDADIVTGKTATFTLLGGVDQLTWDAGLTLPSIGDYVWTDANGNGIQEATETGLNGVTVNLYCNGTTTVVKTTTTANNPVGGLPGWYNFTNVNPTTCDYQVEFVKPAGTLFGQKDNATTTDLLDSDADVTTGKTAAIHLVAGVDQMTWDAGIYTPACIGDFVWLDLNHNGIQDAGETGVAGAVVTLQSGGAAVTLPSGVAVGPITTGATGAYSFCNLPAGSYTVTVTPPTGYAITLQDQGADTTDSDINPTTGVTTTITLVNGVDQLTWDAGLTLPSLGDYVWIDKDGDGNQDVGEVGLNGVTVNLYCFGTTTVLQTTTTANNPIGGLAGYYQFKNLSPTLCNYQVEFVKPAGYLFGRKDSPLTTDLLDSDADLTTGKTGSITMAAGVDQMQWDAGVYLPACIGDFVWLDANHNGIQDAGETVMPGVVMSLTYADGTPVIMPDQTTVGTQTTDANGIYKFCNLPEATYQVHTTLPNGYALTYPDLGTNDAVDSDFSPNTPVQNPNTQVNATPNIVLLNGVDQLTWDAGLYQPSLGDYAWLDIDHNGKQDAGEPPEPNLKVDLYSCADANTVVRSTTTDATGFYIFKLVPVGCWTLKFELPNGKKFTLSNEPNVPDTLDSDVDVSTHKTNQIVLGAFDDMTQDAGTYQPRIGDFVWYDVDGDGIQDATEKGNGINGLTVNLYKVGDPAVSQTTKTVNNPTTGLPGWYYFSVKAGDYYLTFEAPQGMISTKQNQGLDEELDSDGHPKTLITPVLTVVAVEDQFFWDQGFTMPACIGDRVYEDLDGDGVEDLPTGIDTHADLIVAGRQSEGEPGIPGVTVTLVDEDGHTQTMVTDSIGRYNFCDLLPGKYTVKIDKTQDAIKNYPYFTYGYSSTSSQEVSVTLNAGDHYKKADFGYLSNVQIGDQVFVDNNKDCIFNGDDKGVEGIKLNLKDKLGNIIATTRTDKNGIYHFIIPSVKGNTVNVLGVSTQQGVLGTEVSTKDYTVEVDPSYKTTKGLIGFTPTCPTSKSPPELTRNQNYVDLDFGFICLLPNTGASALLFWIGGALLIITGVGGVVYMKARKKKELN